MVLIGLLLILIAIAAGVWLVIGTQSLTTPIDLDTPGFHVSATPLALLIAGAAVLFVLWLGLAAIRSSVKRRRRPAREAKEAQRQAEFEENIRADERARAEETHQSAMAERDRVREDEFSAKVGERDRIRDADERTRLAEHEQRVRADERARVEEEHRRRNAEAARAAAASAGAVGTGAGSAGAATGTGAARDGDTTAGDAGGREADVAGRHEGREERGAGASERVYDQHADHTEDAVEPGVRGHTDSADVRATDAEAPGGVPAEGTSTWDTSRRDRTAEDESGGGATEDAEAADAEDEGKGHRFRTVADEIMGRRPTGRD